MPNIVSLNDDQQDQLLYSLMTETEAAEYLSVSVSSLRKDRNAASLNARRERGVAIPFLKIRGCVRYSRVDLVTWIQSQKTGLLPVNYSNNKEALAHAKQELASPPAPARKAGRPRNM